MEREVRRELLRGLPPDRLVDLKRREHHVSPGPDGGPEGEPPFTAAFLSDGIYIEVDDGDVAVGVWEATGPDTVAMMFTATNEEGSRTVRASITVDGDNISADFTIELHGEGAPMGEYGQGQVTGTRVAAEPMGGRPNREDRRKA